MSHTSVVFGTNLFIIHDNSPEFEVTLIFFIYKEDFSLHFISEIWLEYIVAALVTHEVTHMGGPTVALQFDEREAWRDVNAVISDKRVRG